jgi:hypothetical protein
MSLTQTRSLILALIFAILLPATAHAVISIVAGNHVLPNTPGLYTIPVMAYGPDPIQGFNLNLVTGDGGPNIGGPSGGTIPAPIITAVDVIGPGTIFELNNTGNRGFIYNDQIAERWTTTDSGWVEPDANGNLLALVTVDTTGFGPGTWHFGVTGAFGGLFLPSDLAGSEYPPLGSGIEVPFTLTDGSITIVPEPSTIVMCLCGALLLAIGRSRDRWAKHLRSSVA